MQLLRRISTSKQLFVQRLDEEDGDEDEVEAEVEADLQRGLELDVNSNCHMTEAIYEELQLDECNQNEAPPELALELARRRRSRSSSSRSSRRRSSI